MAEGRHRRPEPACETRGLCACAEHMAELVDRIEGQQAELARRLEARRIIDEKIARHGHQAGHDCTECEE